MKVIPVEIKKLGDSGLQIHWSDGHQSHFTSSQLRAICPCAACFNKLKGERRFDPAKIAKDLKILKADSVGNYALGFGFSDGHRTGIYPFDYLRNGCPCCVEAKRDMEDQG